MKARFAAFGIALLFAFGLTLVYVRGGNSRPSSGGTADIPGPQVTDPFSKLDFPRDQASLAFFTEGDTLRTILSAGRFYWGAQPLPGGMASEYDQARAELIDQIMKEADGSIARIILSGTGLTKGAWQEAKLIWQQGINYVDRKKLIAAIAKLGEGLSSAADVPANMRELSAKRQTLKALEEAMANLGARMTTYARVKLVQAAKGAPKEIIQSLEDLFKTKFEKSMSGAGEVLKTVYGENLEEVMDQYLASWVDGVLSETIASIEQEFPAAAEIAGTYDGQLTIASLEGKPSPASPGKQQGKADEESCDLGTSGLSEVDLQKLIGKSFPIQIALRPDSDTSGTVEMSAQGSKQSQKAPYRYLDEGGSGSTWRRRARWRSLTGSSKKPRDGSRLKARSPSSKEASSVR